jgi:hypothetical protein
MRVPPIGVRSTTTPAGSTRLSPTHTGVATGEVRPQRPERGIGVGRGDDRHEQGPTSAPGASHLLVRLAPQRDSNPCRHP